MFSIECGRLPVAGCVADGGDVYPLRELGGRDPTREAIDVNHVCDVEPVVADARPVSCRELDDFDGPAVRGVVAVSHQAILPQAVPGSGRGIRP